MCSICPDTVWPHVNCTFAVHRSYCNCVVERIEMHLHYRPVAFAAVGSTSSSCPNWLIAQMSSERLNSDALPNNRYKWKHHTSPMTMLDSLHCNRNMSNGQKKREKRSNFYPSRGKFGFNWFCSEILLTLFVACARNRWNTASISALDGPLVLAILIFLCCR